MDSRICAGLVALWTLLPALAGCGSSEQMVARFGTYEVAEDLQLSVTTKGMTLVEYELRNTNVDRLLITDSIGRNRGQWFLFWDETGRLWVHSRDAGTAVWIPSRSGRYHRNPIIMGSPFVETMPKEVAKSLPTSAQRSLGLANAR